LALFEMSALAACTQCLTESLNGAALEAAYGVLPPALPATIGGSLACQNSLDKAGSLLADRWAKGLAHCENRNANGSNVPALDCSTDPDGRIAAAKAAAGRKVDACADFSGIAGCATEATAAAVKACFETAVGDVVDDYTRGAYP
jgi:hypothetical protein